jgi:hypothetical protein
VHMRSRCSRRRRDGGSLPEARLRRYCRTNSRLRPHHLVHVLVKGPAAGPPAEGSMELAKQGVVGGLTADQLRKVRPKALVRGI